MTTSDKRGFTTAILHSDRDAAIEHGALHKPLHLSVAYGYRDARELAAVFQGRAAGYAYGRQGNPTSAALGVMRHGRSLAIRQQKTRWASAKRVLCAPSGIS
jgi:O-acetylhomoserine/O-acetylserine sulfhydrylase-like pyridoxal-dependent enzyme